MLNLVLPKGDKGDTGLQGPAGPQGPKGATGDTGPAGADGKDGKDGANGSNGANGRDGADGQDGADGRGIVSINKTGTSGLIDTYTITYTDNTTSTYTVTNGADGSSESDEIYSRTETLTNKKYVDANNTSHAVYRKILTFPANTQISTVTISGSTFKAVAHGISGFGQVVDFYIKAIMGGLSVIGYPTQTLIFNSQYILAMQESAFSQIIPQDGSVYEVVLEYTKS